MNGALVLADVSGYTRFLGGVELEHSLDILADLIGAAARPLEADFVLNKLEGDAVFCHGPLGADAAACVLRAVAESHASFSRMRRTIAVRTTCDCDACASVASLDLKLVAHYGSYVEHEVAGRRELVGRDVIVAHRLLKNTIDVSAYAFLTDPLVAAAEIEPDALGAARHTESYEDVGEVPGWVWDLGLRFAEEEAAAGPLVVAGTETAAGSAHAAASPDAVWEVLTDPVRQIEWRIGATDLRTSPRSGWGPGTVNHCVHGRAIFDQEIVDWRPPQRWSYHERGPAGRMDWTFELAAAADGGTDIAGRVRFTGGWQTRFPLARATVRRTVATRLPQMLANLAALADR